MDEPASTKTPLEHDWSPPLPAAPGFEHIVVETPGARSHVAVMGAGEPVMMLHGFPQHWWEWRLVPPRLDAHGFRPVGPGLRRS